MKFFATPGDFRPIKIWGVMAEAVEDELANDGMVSVEGVAAPGVVPIVASPVFEHVVGTPNRNSQEVRDAPRAV